jgi:hypothetical protein
LFCPLRKDVQNEQNPSFSLKKAKRRVWKVLFKKGLFTLPNPLDTPCRKGQTSAEGGLLPGKQGCKNRPGYGKINFSSLPPGRQRHKCGKKEKRMYCPNCKKEYHDKEAQFCPICGERLISEVPGKSGGKKLRYDVTYEEEREKGKFPLIIIPILLAAALLLFLLMNDGIRRRLFGEPVVEDINQEETEEEAETEVEVVNQGEPAEEPKEEEEEKPEEEPAEEPAAAEPQVQEPQEAPEEEPAEPVREEQVVTTNGQVFPDSGSRYLSDGEIGSLGLSQTQYAINEIYARHGYIFGTEPYKSYYESQPWYQGTISPDQFSDSVFNEYEYENVEKLGAHRDALAQ